MKVRVPSGARWSCQGCGECCHHFALGPVEPALISRLEGLLGPDHPPWVERREDGGHYFLHQPSGACVFLTADRRCHLHATYGADHKPDFCLQFPLEGVLDPRGAVVVVRPECGRYHDTFQRSASIERLLADTHLSLRRFQPEQVHLDAHRAVPLEAWMGIEGTLLARIEALEGEAPAVAVSALRRGLGDAAPPSAARFSAAFAAMGVLSRAAIAQQPDPLGGLLRDMLDRAESCAQVPALTPEASRYLNLLLRSFIQAKSFAPYESVAVGLGLFLFNVELARRASASGAVDQIGPALGLWARFSLNASVRPLMRHAAPALLDLYQHADG